MARVGWWATALAGATLVAGGCAQQEFPPGGPEDRRPPVIVETFPQPLGNLTELDAAVRFRFDERISERAAGGDLASAIRISPRTGPLQVDKGARSLEIRPEGGFQPGQVYRVTVGAAISDLFGNRMTDPFELVFTTGEAEAVPTTLAGEIWDRVSGRAVNEATIVAVADDGVVHQAASDSRGIYALRYLPGGNFRITAFEDRDRDGEPDSTEVQGVITADLAQGDTLLVDVPILAPDTSAAQVTRAEAVDSTIVSVTFDDFLDPDADASTFQVSLSLADSTATGPVPEVERVLQEAAYAEYVDAVGDSLARLDSLAAAARAAARAAEEPADTAAVGDTAARSDTVAVPDTAVAPDSAVVPDTAVAPDTAAAGEPSVPADTVRMEPGPGGLPTPGDEPPPDLPPLEGVQAGPTRDGRRVLPGRRVVLLLSDALEHDVEYRVRVSGVPNIVGLPGGEGSADFVRERPPPPDSASADTASASDTAAVPDTGTVAAGDEGTITVPDAGTIARRRAGEGR